MDALTLDPAIADDLILTAEEWEAAQKRIEVDAEFRGLIGRLFREGLSPSDLYGAPLWFPEDWLDPKPDLEPGTKIGVTAAGQVEGYFFEWGECVIRGGGKGDCWTPPTSRSGYDPFHQSDAQVVTASGERKLVKAGMIGIGGHAPQNASFAQAIRHYQFPTRGRMITRAYENEVGGYVRGSLLPQATFADVALIRASALSGHWEYRDRFHDLSGRVVAGYDCLGPCMVTRPGLPLVRESRYQGSGDVVQASAGGPALPRRIVSSIGQMAAADDETRRTIEIAGGAEVVERVESLLAAIEWAGNAGTSRKFSIFIDGDDRLSAGGLEEANQDEIRAELEGIEADEIVVASIDMGTHKESVEYHQERPIEENEMKITLTDGTVLEKQDNGHYVPVKADGGGKPPCACGGHQEEDEGAQTAVVSDEQFAQLQETVEGLARKVEEMDSALGEQMMDAAEEGTAAVSD